MDITKMITISTAHITNQTIEFLEKEAYRNNELVVYPKAEYGWFIYVCEDDIENTDLNIDLRDCLSFAYGNDCQWLAFDRDGVIENNLSIYQEIF